MKISDVLDLVGKISEDLVFADQNDFSTVENFPEKFGDLAAILLEMGKEAEAAACRKAAILTAGWAEGSLDWDEGLEILTETINALQAVLGQECSFEEAGFPSRLSDSEEAGEPAPTVAPTKPAQPTQPTQPTK
ncbi:MAG: hypothetical protein KOO60_00680, partial [Gemmatimonadales bacterium]|nr:hypothetical protein [Gemmatimonadales bacterium]